MPSNQRHSDHLFLPNCRQLSQSEVHERFVFSISTSQRFPGVRNDVGNIYSGREDPADPSELTECLRLSLRRPNMHLVIDLSDGSVLHSTSPRRDARGIDMIPSFSRLFHVVVARP